MRTWVLWTHHDCDIGVSLHPSAEHAWDELKDNWLDDCNVDDCGHVTEDMDISDIANAMEYHWDGEMDWGIDEMSVPEPVVRPPKLTAERVERPTEQNAMPAAKADELLSRLQSFQEQS